MAGTQLTPTEYAILDGIREGRVDAEIAARLGITIADVKRRVEHLQTVAGVEERAALANWDPGQVRVASPPGASPYAALPSDEQPVDADAGSQSTPAAEEPGANSGPALGPRTATEDSEGGVSRRGLLLGAFGMAVAGATGAYFLFNSRGDSAASPDRPRFEPSSPTPTPATTATPTPAATPTPVPGPSEVYRDDANWLRASVTRGGRAPGEHGIGFMDTATGNVDILRLNAPESGLGLGYMASPGNRFVSAWGFPRVPGSGGRAGIFDRETGTSWAFAYERLGVTHLEDDYVLLQAYASPDHLNRTPGPQFYLVDENMRELARFETDPHARYSYVRDPEGPLLFMIGTDRVLQLHLPSGDVSTPLTVSALASRLGTPAELYIRHARVVAGAFVVELEGNLSSGDQRPRYAVSIPIRGQGSSRALDGGSLQVTPLYPRQSSLSGYAEVSPDGRYLLAGNTYRADYNSVGMNEDWAYADLLTYPESTPLFRARSAVLQYGDGLTDRRWLSDSSGFVAYVQSDDAGVETSRDWLRGRHYAVIGVDGSVHRLPGTEDTSRLGTWYGAAPVPAPDNPDLFSLGRRALLNASTEEIIPVELPSEAPAHLDPWGNTSAEMRFAYPHDHHAGVEAATVLPLQFEDAPFEAGLEFVVARTVSCAELRDAPASDTAIIDCLPDGTRCTVAPDTLPEGRGNPPYNYETAFQWEANQAYIRVRSEFGDEGWLAMQFLDWA